MQAEVVKAIEALVDPGSFDPVPTPAASNPLAYPGYEELHERARGRSLL